VQTQFGGTLITSEEYLEALRFQASADVQSSLNPLQKYYATSQFQKEVGKAQQDAIAEALEEHYARPVPSPASAVGEFDADKVIWMEQLTRLHGLISDAGGKVNVSTPEKPKFGTLPLGSLNAMVLTVPGSEERLVIFNDGIFFFIHLFVKVMVLCFETVAPLEQELAKQKNANSKQELIASSLTKQAQARFHELLFAYVIRGNPAKAQPWLLPAKFGGFQELLLTACEMFILAHEYGHIVLGHTDAAGTPEANSWTDLTIQMVNRSIDREIQADAWAAPLILVGLSAGGNVPYAFAGIEIFFQAAEMIERAVSILNNGIEGGADELTHPRAGDRRDVLRYKMIAAFGPAIEQNFRIGDLVASICEALWAEERGFFLDQWEEGVKPARIWTTLT
jgi:hypothetical protein